MLGDQAIDQLGKEPSTEERMDLILIIIILLLLFGGGFGYSRWGYGGGIGIGGILLIVLVIYVVSRTRKIVIFAPPSALTPFREPPFRNPIRIATSASVSEPHLPSRTLGALCTRS